jgi:putative oxidoreductase
MDLGLFLLRLTVGLTLAAHGTQKLFGWFGGPGLDAIGQGFEMLGFHPGRRHAVMAGLVETGAGLLLALGFLTPIAAAGVFAVMLVAGVSAHAKQGFFITSGGYEYTLVLGVAGLAVAFTGPGALSLDALLGSSLSGTLSGVIALVVGLVGGAIQLTQRHPAGALHTASFRLSDRRRDASRLSFLGPT